MNVRLAEPRDIPAITEMFKELCSYLEDKGQWTLNPDWKQRENGIVALVSTKMVNEGNVVLVSEDAAGRANGFLIGWVLYYPSIFAHQRVGEIQFMFPLNFEKSPHLERAFDKWAKKQGCTATSNYATPGHTASVKAFERAGRKLTHYCFMKPYPKEEAKNVALHG